MNNYYTTLQHQQFSDEFENSRREQDDNLVFAKSIKKGYSTDMTKSSPMYYKYYIRIHPNKKLYDPFPLYSIGDAKNSFVEKVCKSDSCYKEVNASIFKMYLNYLRSENSQWYNKAQRECNNLSR